MKTIKTSFAKTGVSLYCKALISGVLVSVLSTVLLLMLTSLLLKAGGTLPYDMLVWITIAITAVSVLAGGYITALITKKNGMFSGAICGIIIFLILMISGLCISEDSITFVTVIKLVAFTVLGCIGGILGVNKKDKIRIK